MLRAGKHMLQLSLEYQNNRVADEVSAMIAVVRPILKAILFGLRRDIVESQGGHDKIPLHVLARLYKAGDGDCGICFEYAVHDAITRQDPLILDRIYTALARHCHLDGSDVNSILFGIEKNGALQLLDSVQNSLTDDSLLMVGKAGAPIKLKRHIRSIASAFRSKQVQMELPPSISGLWKADLFLGMRDSDRWVGTTVKINENDLVGAAGLRIGIVPARWGRYDGIRRDEKRNLIVCPLAHDGDFMEIFYRAWGVVVQVLACDALMPTESRLPTPSDRYVAKLLVERRTFTVPQVLDGLEAIAQPELLLTNHRPAALNAENTVHPELEMLVAPLPVGLT